VLLVARKNLFSERTRLAISVGGVALSVFLISLLLALFRGWSERVGGFVEEVNVDVWVARTGTTDFLTAASFLPMKGSESLNRLDAVEQWSPLIVRQMKAQKGDSKMDVQLVGYDLVSGMGGPLRIVEGKSTPGPGEVIVDKMLTKRYGVDIGDSLEAGGRDWKVVGKSEGGDFVASQTIFVGIDQAREALEMADLTTFFVLRLGENVDGARFAADLEHLQPGILAITGKDFAEATRDRVLGNIIPILMLILVVAFIVGLAVDGLTIYTATVEKSREYGILKAVGFANGYLYRLVFEQSMVTGALGFAIGIGLTLLFVPFAKDLVPQFVVFVRWQDVLGVFAATVLMTALAGYMPVRRLSAIDPVAVFKA